MHRIGLHALALVATLLFCGCCDPGGDETTGGTLRVINDTNYYVHFWHDDGAAALFVEPGTAADLHVEGSGDLMAFYSPGQGMDDESVTTVSCCDENCGTVHANVESGRIRASSTDGRCNYSDCSRGSDSSSDDDDEGSCPYVYAHDGRRFVLAGETLVGALHAGGQRTDVFALPQLRPKNGVYQVRLAAVLRETDFVDRVALRVVDHERRTRVITDAGNRVYTVSHAAAPRKAIDAAGRNLTRVLARDDRRRWIGKNRSSTLGGNHRDWVVLEFPRPADPSGAVLVVRGRNTQFVQDTYHAYMAHFGGAAKTILRFLSKAPWYPAVIASMMEEASFGIDVALDGGLTWDSQGAVKPIGPAGLRTVVLPLKLPKRPGWLSPSDRIRIRMAVVPGAWELDSVQLASRGPAPVKQTTVLPRAATFGQRGKAATKLDPRVLLRIDRQRQTIPHDHRLTVQFAAPPRTPGQRRTVLLDVTGYYTEHAPSPLARFTIRLDRILESYLVPDHFAWFVVDALGRRASGHRKRRR